MKPPNSNICPYAKCVDIVIILIGGWTLYVQFFTYSGFNFNQLLTWSPTLLFIFPFIILSLNFRQSPSLVNAMGNDSVRKNESTVQAVWIPLIGLFCGVLSKQLWVVALSAIFYLGWIAAWDRSFLCKGIDATPSSNRSGNEIVVLLAVMALTGTLTLVVNRPDIDDAYYLNASATTLRNSELPLLSFDGMHGDPNIPIQQSDHRPQTYMLFVAFLATLTKLSPRTIYYVLLPPFWAAMVPLGYYVVIKKFCVKSAWLALIISMLLLLAWGESHQVFGNFAFVRLFQSKAIFVALLCPLLVYYTLEYMEKQDWRAWSMLLLAQISSVGLSTTAAVVAPLSVFLALFAFTGLSKQRLLPALSGACTLLYNGLILYWVLSERVVNPGVVDQAEILNVYHVIGSGIRGSITLLLFLLLPLIMLRQNHPYRIWMWRYVLASVILLFNGFTTDLAGHFVSGVFSWRLFWAVPLPLFLGMGFGLAAEAYFDHSDNSGKQKMLWLMGGASVLVIFLMGGRWSISPVNQVFFDGPGPKVSPYTREAVEIVLQHASPTDLVLAPEVVASVLTGYKDHPRMLYVRPHYTRHLQWHFGKQEVEKRLRLGQIADYGCVSAGEYDWMIQELQRREVKVLVLFNNKDAAKCKNIMPWLRQYGYANTETQFYQIWNKQH